jgi:hypothetical protein
MSETAHDLARWLLEGPDAPVQIVIVPGRMIPDLVTSYPVHDITTRGAVRIHVEEGSRDVVLLIAEYTQTPRSEA